MLCQNTSEIVCKIKIESNNEKLQNSYFIISFCLFQIIPAFILSTLNLKLILMVRECVNDSKSLQKVDLLISNNQANNSINSTVRKNSSISRQVKFTTRGRQNSNQVDASLPILKKQFKTQSIISISSCKSISERLGREQVKLTRTLIAVTCFELISEISSIITYDRIADFLLGRLSNSYMKNGYLIQKLISMTIVVTSHSVNFFLYCAFNARYLDILKNLYCHKRRKHIPLRRNAFRSSQKLKSFQIPPF